MKTKKIKETQTKNYIRQKHKIDNFYSDWMTRIEASIYLSCSLNWLDTKCPVKKHYLGKHSPRYLKKDLNNYLLSSKGKELNIGGKNE